MKGSNIKETDVKQSRGLLCAGCQDEEEEEEQGKTTSTTQTKQRKRLNLNGEQRLKEPKSFCDYIN